MTRKENPAPRGNAGNRANPKVGQGHIRASAVDWEADPATIWVCAAVPHVDDACARPGRAGEPRGGLAMSGPIDFAEINRAALAAFPAVLNRLLPRGKVVGREIVALNPRRADRNLGSFKVNRFNGRWCDFATGDRGGDPISLVAYLADVSQGDAARLLAQMLGMETRGPRRD
jgi:hypothetical protein